MFNDENNWYSQKQKIEWFLKKNLKYIFLVNVINHIKFFFMINIVVYNIITKIYK